MSRIDSGRSHQARSWITNAAFACALHAFVATNASATECVGIDVCALFEQAAAVFVGRVESIAESRYVALTVLEPFKGTRGHVITSEEPDRRVGRPGQFTVGETYRVFAYNAPESRFWSLAASAPSANLSQRAERLSNMHDE